MNHWKIVSIFCIAFTLSLQSFSKEASPEIQALEKRIVSVVDLVDETVVAIAGQQGGQGSGVIVSSDGLILTAAHVVGGQEEVNIILANGNTVRAKVLGMNNYKDAAMCQIINAGEYPFASLGNSTEMKVTDWVVALGHERGYDENRTAPVRFGRLRAQNAAYFITTDCVLIGGDSGGPLFDLNGKLVAIHSSINGLAKFNVHAGISGYIEDWERMKNGERWGSLNPNVAATPETPFLGISWTDRSPLAVINEVVSKSPAAIAGLRAADQIVSIDQDQIRTQNDVIIALGRKAIGQRISVGVKRGNKKISKSVLLAQKRGEQLGRRSFIPTRLRETDDSPFIKPGDKKKLQKQALKIYNGFTDLVSSKAATYIGIYSPENGTSPSLYGTIVADETVLAPLSAYRTLEGELIAWKPGEEGRPIELIGGYPEHDLAVLKVPGMKAEKDFLNNLPDVTNGNFLVAVGQGDDSADALHIGVVSVDTRTLQGFLGVGLTDDPNGKGALITGVVRGKAASRMGILPNDIITKINENAVTNAESLISEIQKLTPGSAISITLQRNGELITGQTVLGGKDQSNARIETMDRMGRNSLSVNRTNFKSVIQSDMVVDPEDCGAPVFNSKGKFVGILISDAGRNKSYIVPSQEISSALKEEPTSVENLPKRKASQRIRRNLPRETFRREGSFEPQDLFKEFFGDDADPIEEMKRIMEEMFRGR